MNCWYPHYPGDYARDTAHLTLVQHGAFRLLLDHYYSTEGPLPADPASLYRICRAFDETERQAVDFVVANFFKVQPDGYHNGRADAEIAKRADQHLRLSNGAKKAMRNRWGADRQATSQAIKQPIARPQPQPQPHIIKKNPAAKPAPPPDPRHKAFFDFSYQLFQSKYLQSPAWGNKEAGQLQNFLKQHAGISLEELKRRYHFFLQSTDHYYKQAHGSLGFFISNFDRFIDGPIHERGAKGDSSASSQRNRRSPGAVAAAPGKYDSRTPDHTITN